jgi:peroxiredoxin
LAHVAIARRRLLVASLVSALVVSAIGGWLLGRDRGADEVVNINNPALAGEPQGAIPTAPALDGDPLPAVTLRTADGTEVDLLDLGGQPTVINLWFTTCQPCKKELPDFAVVHNELGERVRFIGVNPTGENADRAAAFAAERGVAYELYSDPTASLPTTLGIGTFPATLFVTPDGVIRTTHQGALDADELRRLIDEELLS